MRAWSLSVPIFFQQGRRCLREASSFCWRQIRFFVLGKDSQQKYREVLPTEEIDDARSAAFAAPASREPHLAQSSGARNYHSATRVSRHLVYNAGSLVVAKQPFRICKIWRSLDDSMHCAHIRQCRSKCKPRDSAPRSVLGPPPGAFG